MPKNQKIPSAIDVSKQVNSVSAVASLDPKVTSGYSVVYATPGTIDIAQRSPMTRSGNCYSGHKLNLDVIFAKVLQARLNSLTDSCI